MNCLEKRHKAGTQHLAYSENFMDETDREVMSLTDRAFKSLCIGDEAIYNDSEFSPSPVSCHKPLVEDIPKKTQENCSMAVKKHGARPLNGAVDASWQMKKDSSLFAAFSAKRNGDTTAVVNGDSWDKSALLSIQRELSEFSSDYHNSLADVPQVKNHLKSSEKRAKSSKDTPTQSGKSTKSKHSKSSKLRKLNSKNFFLHSEFSPFQSWRDLNKFPFGLDNIDIFPSTRPPEWYDSPLYKRLTMSHRLHESNKEERSVSLAEKTETKVLQQVTQTLPSKAESLIQPKIHAETQPQVLRVSSSSEQRCQSEGDTCVPWRKNRSRAKSAVPVGQPVACEWEKAGEEDVRPNKMEVRTMEEQASSSSTPFSILQLLTPVIPSRQGTGSSEILQNFLLHELPPLPEAEMRPSPEIKREGYKSKASSLLFNLKDNRKRVKTMYSPPKFKGLDPGDQTKLSPLVEKVVIENGQEDLEITDEKGSSPAHAKAHVSPETGDHLHCHPGGQVNEGLLDDFLGLSLLQVGNRGSPIKPSRSNKSPAVNKVTYPSLSLYRKVSQVESDSNTTQILADPGSHPATDKGTKKEQIIDPTLEVDGKKRQRSVITTPGHLDQPMDTANLERTHAKSNRTAGEVGSKSIVQDRQTLSVLNKHNTRSDAGNRNQDKQNGGEIGKMPSPVKDKECLKKEPKPKRLFSARQNNYIKSQRYVSVDEQDEYEGEQAVSAGRDKHSDGAVSRTSGGLNVREGRKNVGVHKAKETGDGKPVREDVKNDSFDKNDCMIVSGTCNEQSVGKSNALTMKGNTSAKRALFASKERTLGVPGVVPKKESVSVDKYELAKAALEEVIAEREQRKKQSDEVQGLKRRGRPDVMQEDFEQVLASSQKDTLESVIKEKRAGQKGTSDFKPRSQIVQTMLERDTKHGGGHVAEVNLARPYERGGTADGSQHSAGQIKYTERDRTGRHRQSEPDQVKLMDKVTRLKEKVPVPKNKSLVEETSGVASVDSKLTELVAQKKSKPDVPPRRGRANSQSEVRCDTERREDVERTVDKNEKLIVGKVMKGKPFQSKDRGPVRGQVSVLKEKFDKEQGVQSVNVQEPLSQGEDIKDDPKITKKEIVPKASASAPPFEIVPKSLCHVGSNSDNTVSKLAVSNETTGRQEDIKSMDEDIVPEKDGMDKKSAADILRDDSQNKPKDDGTHSVKELLNEPERVKKVKAENEITTSTLETSGMFKAADGTVDSVMVYDILQQSEPSTSVDLSHQVIPCSDSSNPTGEPLDLTTPSKIPEEKLEQTSEPCTPDRVLSPPSDLEKGGWVRCLMESARNLTPTCHSSASSPTMGRPALFKVKDNTFSSSPVTKTVRPILHKTVSEFSQPWSPRESLSGSERGEQELFKDCTEIQSPNILSPTPPSTPVRSPEPKQSSMPHPASQLSTSGVGKGQMDSLSVPEEDEMQSAVSSFSEGIESCGSVGDAVEGTISVTLPKEDLEAPSERSGSACSSTENQSQGKPPAVPPKTEKGLRRAMKLTTRRIQKAEAKSKPERKGRSSDKSSNHKPERRQRSCDSRVNQSAEENPNLRITHRHEKHSENHSRDVDASGKPGHQISVQADAKNRLSEEIFQGQLAVRNVDAYSERLGRTSVKHLPDKLDRRAHSLDRFVSDRPELSKTTSGLSKRSPVHQNSIEHAFAATATNIISPSFPMTQRKLLQDLDSGQYFVVDMPVQVKTKTFFDPETGRYVQLPVQSPEASVPQAQSVEVVNAPPLVLYHGFVPVPLPAQKSRGKPKAGGQAYVDPAQAREHLAADELDNVR